jgi:hypothetical protein
LGLLFLAFQGCGGNSSASLGSTGDAECPDPTFWVCNDDLHCNTSEASTDATCNIDCTVPCGFAQLGTKYCSCIGGVYAQCPCPRPDAYQGKQFAKYCDDPDFPLAWDTGLMQAVKGNPCPTEWEQCIARDVPPGSTPRACACLANPSNGALQWYCGSTNKWFFPEE